MMVNSIVRSQRIIGTGAVGKVVYNKTIPDVETLTSLSLQELRNLTISKCSWYGVITTLDFALNNGQSLRSGKKYNFGKSHIFDPIKKISRIQCILMKYEHYILQINFYHHDERLVQLGCTDDSMYQNFGGGGRIEVFEIAENEQFMGCELESCESFFRGVTWLKMKLY